MIAQEDIELVPRAPRTEEHDLLLSMIRQAIEDRLIFASSDEEDGAGDRKADEGLDMGIEASATWFLFHDPSFNDICDRVNLNSETVRKRLRAAEEYFYKHKIPYKRSHEINQVIEYIMEES